jgi:hypothetical protein
MRFISRFGRYGVQIRPQIQEAFATGMVRIIQTPLNAYFHEGGLLPSERDLAVSRWSFNGFYQEQDEVTIVAPDYRIGVFDSVEHQIANQWTNEERKQVEVELISLAERFPNDLLVVAETVIMPPWPHYDNYSGGIAKLITKIEEDGYSIADVLAYERQSQNREDVIDALEQMVEDESAVEEVVG